MGISTTSLGGIANLTCIPPKRTETRLRPHGDSEYGKIRHFSPSPISTFRNLPTELVLAICSQLPAYDLFFHVRPTCRLLHTCAQETLSKSISQHSHVQISWCCFWCSLGDLSLPTIAKDITPLFSASANLHAKGMTEKGLVAKLAFGEIYSMVLGQQKVRVSIGEEEEKGVIIVKTRELQRCLNLICHDREERRYALVCFFFAKLRKGKRRWRTVSGLVWVTRMLGLVVVGCWLLVVVGACLSIFLVGREGYQLVVWFCGLCTSGVRGFIRYVDASWKEWKG
jgi:hypothetical protein